MRIFCCSIALVCVGLPLIGAPALDRKDRAILKNRFRPTMAQLDKVIGKQPMKNPWAAYLSRESLDVLKRVQKDGPRVIATLEAGFPNAVYLPLGRDAAVLGDMIDAFYRAHGIRGRVQRLHASTSTFLYESSMYDNTIPIQLLLAEGVPLEPHLSRPFVILDRTSFQTEAHEDDRTSQSARILHAYYQLHRALFGSDLDLIRRFNVVSTDDVHSTSRLVAAENKYQLNGFFATQEMVMRTEPYFPTQALSLQSQISDGAAWHDTYEELEETKHGVRTQPGELGSVEERRAVLAEMFELRKLVSTKEFHEKVMRYAESIWTPFSLSAQTHHQPNKGALPSTSVVKQILNSLRTTAKALEHDGVIYLNRKANFEDHMGENTINGKTIERWLEQYLWITMYPTLAADFYQAVIGTIVRLLKDDKIVVRDVRNLLRQIALAGRRTEHLNRGFASALLRDQALLQIWAESRDLFFVERDQFFPGSDEVLGLRIYDEINQQVMLALARSKKAPKSCGNLFK